MVILILARFIDPPLEYVAIAKLLLSSYLFRGGQRSSANRLIFSEGAETILGSPHILAYHFHLSSIFFTCSASKQVYNSLFIIFLSGIIQKEPKPVV